MPAQRALFAFVLAALAACGDGGTNPVPPATVSGDWRFNESFRDQLRSIACSDTGTLTVVEEDMALTAVLRVMGQCTGPGGSIPVESVDTVAGTLVGARLSFDIYPCQYRGTVLEGAPPTGSGTVTCRFTDGGVQFDFRGNWQVRYLGDRSPPTTTGTLAGPLGDTLTVPGDPVGILVRAGDNLRLAWGGYRLGPPASVADSAPLSGRSDSAAFSLVVPAAWLGNSSVTFFSRDSAGLGAEATGGLLRAVDLVRRPTRMALLDAPVHDVAFDARRNALYLSHPERRRVAVLSLVTLSYGPAISLTAPPAGLDLTLGGDSLLVALAPQDPFQPGRAYVVVVNLVTGEIDSIEVSDQDASTDRWPRNVRVTANNKAFVSLTFNGTGYGGRLAEYDLGTGAQRIRFDAGVGGSLPENVPLVVPADRSKMLLLEGGGCCPVYGQVYRAAADAIGPERGTVSTFRLYGSADGSGARFLVTNALYDSTLTLIREFNPPEYGLPNANGPSPTVVTPGGDIAYFGTELGYLKVRMSDGVVLERVRLPHPPFAFTLLPDGNALVARTDPWLSSTLGDRVFIVDLR